MQRVVDPDAPSYAPAMAADSDSARGVVAIGAAKSLFLLAGVAQSVLLPLAIGQGAFGSYKRAIAFANIVNNVLVAASLQTVARSIAGAHPADRPATLRRALLLQGLVGLLVSIAFYAAIPAMVAYQHDAALAAPLRAIAVVPFAYSLYACLVGSLNGERRFVAQAGLDAGYATARTLLLVGAGALFVARASDGALGASTGFSIAAVVVVFVALLFVRLRGQGASASSSSAHLRALGAILIMQALQTAVLQLDVLVLGRAATIRFESLGFSADRAAAAADRIVGLYAQAQAFGLVPYQLLLAASLVLFPAIAAARARSDDAGLARSLLVGGRLTAIVGGAIVAAIAGAPRALLTLFYGARSHGDVPATAGALVLAALAIAHLGTAIIALAASLLAAASRTRAALVVAGSSLFCGLIGMLLAAALRSVDPLAIASQVAVGLLAGIAVAVGFALFVVRRALAPMIPASTGLRVVVALAVAILVGHFVPTPHARLLCALSPIVPLLVYIVVLVLAGERRSVRST